MDPANIGLRYDYVDPPWSIQAALAASYPRTLSELEAYLTAHPRVGCAILGESDGVRIFQEMLPMGTAGLSRISWLYEDGEQAHCYISESTVSFDAAGVSVGDGEMPSDIPAVRYTYCPDAAAPPQPVLPQPVSVPITARHFSQMQLINQLRRDLNEKCAELTAARSAAEHTQYRLDEITAERDALRAVTDKDVWYWQDDNSNYLESLTCRIVLTAEQLRALLATKTPVVTSHIIRRPRG